MLSPALLAEVLVLEPAHRFGYIGSLQVGSSDIGSWGHTSESISSTRTLVQQQQLLGAWGVEFCRSLRLDGSGHRYRSTPLDHRQRRRMYLDRRQGQSDRSPSSAP